MNNQCRSCQAPIVWARSQSTGKWMPIDDESVPDGNIRLDGDEFQVLAGVRLESARTSGEHLHVSHFVTCPYSRQHRRT